MARFITLSEILSPPLSEQHIVEISGWGGRAELLGVNSKPSMGLDVTLETLRTTIINNVPNFGLHKTPVENAKIPIPLSIEIINYCKENEKIYLSLLSFMDQ